MGIWLKGDCGGDVFFECEVLQDGPHDEEVDFTDEPSLVVEVRQHLATPTTVEGIEEVVAGLGVPASNNSFISM